MDGLDWALVDLDDTLVRNAVPFRLAMERMFAEVARRAGPGVGRELAEDAFRRATQPGYRRTGFVQAALRAYWELSAQPREEDVLAVVELAEAPFDHLPEVLPGVEEGLARLTAAGLRVAVWTMGDPVVQASKLARTGLHRWVQRVLAVPRKDEGSLAAALAELGVDGPSRAVLIGNSAADDVRPALATGLRVIWAGEPAWPSERWQPPANAPGLTRAPAFLDAVELLLERRSEPR